MDIPKRITIVRTVGDANSGLQSGEQVFDRTLLLVDGHCLDVPASAMESLEVVLGSSALEEVTLTLRAKGVEMRTVSDTEFDYLREASNIEPDDERDIAVMRAEAERDVIMPRTEKEPTPDKGASISGDTPKMVWLDEAYKFEYASFGEIVTFMKDEVRYAGVVGLPSRDLACALLRQYRVWEQGAWEVHDPDKIDAFLHSSRLRYMDASDDVVETGLPYRIVQDHCPEIAVYLSNEFHFASRVISGDSSRHNILDTHQLTAWISCTSFADVEDMANAILKQFDVHDEQWNKISDPKSIVDAVVGLGLSFVEHTDGHLAYFRDGTDYDDWAALAVALCDLFTFLRD